MCAINPTYKKRFVVDVYTSDTKLDKEGFDMLVIGILLDTETKLNSEHGRFRFHLKESPQEAD